ncbi:Alpha/Beta hydrolase protein [Protomyces lactucae-debilis]|uniref:Alpha/Beta hydrolase protein n=1 Tax=Protomyces lactucae-debilis TaxID=2754530 RepID=A0A1Y2F9H5_PROLT|nr:Alpha/Beta hydrolase protein [Protomyces lactucae-debilis]ORY79545.1 Alpha/Beta hydrolase protein [Protomyces lactucae-debilis]
MGLLASMYSWRETVKHYANRKDTTVLVFDNRGAGKSDAPLGRYTTTMLAEDTLELLDHVGWTKSRSVHVNGVSMGGMIAMQLALVAGERIKSLCLTSTCAKHQNPPRTRLESIAGWIDWFRPKPTNERKVEVLMGRLFTDEAWLDSKNPAYPEFRTNRERVFQIMLYRVTQSKTPRVSGQVGQIAACLTHHCSQENLAKIGQQMPVLVIVGRQDMLIDPACSDVLYKQVSLEGQRSHVRLVSYEKGGHALMVEEEEAYHKELDNFEAQSETFEAKAHDDRK